MSCRHLSLSDCKVVGELLAKGPEWDNPRWVQFSSRIPRKSIHLMCRTAFHQYLVDSLQPGVRGGVCHCCNEIFASLKAAASERFTFVMSAGFVLKTTAIRRGVSVSI